MAPKTVSTSSRSLSICSVEGCDRPVKARGLCNRHYKRWLAQGHPCRQTKITPHGKAQAYFRNVVLTYDGDDCLIWPFNRGSIGYALIGLDGRMQNVHRTACRLVYGPPPSPKHHAAHSCGNGHLGCVNPQHLRWATPKENAGDTLRHGRRNRGERNGNAKLTEVQVREIRASRGKVYQKDLAAKFGVTSDLIYLIQHRKSWTWLD